MSQFQMLLLVIILPQCYSDSFIFILKESLSARKIVCILMALIGLLLILQTGEKSNSQSNNHIIGILYGGSGAILLLLVKTL